MKINTNNDSSWYLDYNQIQEPPKIPTAIAKDIIGKGQKLQCDTHICIKQRNITQTFENSHPRKS